MILPQSEKMEKPNLPKSSYKVIIVPEGQEEEDYLKKLISLDNVFSKDKYDIKCISLASKQNVPYGFYNLISVFSEAYHNIETEGVALIFCDTEMPKHGEYENIDNLLGTLEKRFGIKKEEAINNVVYYSNPNSMKVILSHFGKVNVKKTDISYIRDLVKSYANIDGYDKSYKKRKELMDKISEANYHKLKKNITGKDNSRDYHILSSTDILVLFSALELDNLDWLKQIRKIENLK